MELKELRQKNKPELKNLLETAREQLRVLRFNLAAGKVKNVREVRKVRKEIAQILTLSKQL